MSMKTNSQFSEVVSGRESMAVSSNRGNNQHVKNGNEKPPYLIAEDDTKPVLRDPLWSSDPTQAEQAVLRLPPFPSKMNAKFR